MTVPCELIYKLLPGMRQRGYGRILNIAENTTPMSEKEVPSAGPVQAVLEVRGGTARKLGIAPGDRVANPIFKSR